MLFPQLTPADSSSLSDYSSEPALYFWSCQLYSSISQRDQSSTFHLPPAGQHSNWSDEKNDPFRNFFFFFFFFHSQLSFDLSTDVTSDKNKMDLFSKTFRCVHNPPQGSQWSRFLIVSFLGTGPPLVPAGYRWHSPETRHSDVSDTLARDCKTTIEWKGATFVTFYFICTCMFLFKPTAQLVQLLNAF